jgi:hypothetical protein
MAAQTASEPRTHKEYTVGWVCALPKEQTAATAMLDHNTYTLGSIGKHNIVIACLPKGKLGTGSAATVATQMVGTFPSTRAKLWLVNDFELVPLLPAAEGLGQPAPSCRSHSLDRC